LTRGAGTALDYVRQLGEDLPELMWDGELTHTEKPFLNCYADALVKIDTGNHPPDRRRAVR
jgi:hypothetical protein